MLLDSLLGINFEFDHIKLGKISISLSTIDFLLKKFITICVIVIFMILVIKIGSKLIDKAVQKQIDTNFKFSLDTRKANTLGTLLKSILMYSVYFIGITTILSIIFGNISWAFASVGGVAVGLGAQSFVKDVINGIFILFDNQYNVGDYVTIEGVSGIVEVIGLRTTELRDYDGSLHIIPNGMIRIVTNNCRGDMRVQIDIGISYSEDINKVINTINSVCYTYNKENNNITEPLKVWGVTDLTSSSVNLRICGKVKSMKLWETEVELRKRIKMTLDKKKYMKEIITG
ncbi:mechanosensitive ion channel family protein [Clostridium perfringens]|uniref:Transporter, small conductance mechanosensitive ion channel MscS family protein n=1 Tax=Clostridium perfringens TaxID=1502 RepID=A0A133N2D2_CLOPF|nr:mechanosensitive ion channel family protein [Clostridium perfringens]EGT3600926.1 mechanosensitive ion channel family protein [Clostridium perfringens]KXA10373.1 transporter, small conductance mechanosensitive ion channel MscS family protein [Clostridium perfringens]MDK0980490.1 mechanosensitive ion channel family protein [Clostridium perfringens]MDM0461601.1 mechanosensitive ion channel family protein [Clostridium perfringens]MDM0464619.1 mechanosensitive ion channel family protein [Clostr